MRLISLCCVLTLAVHAYRLSSGALVGIMSSNKGLSHDPHTRRSLA
jgi:hypothetical protein